MRRRPHLLIRAAAAPILAGCAAGALAAGGQDAPLAPQGSPQSRTEASQIPPPGERSGPRVYLDEAPRPASASPLHSRAELTEAPAAPPGAPGGGSAPTPQISTRAEGGGGMAQLSRAELDATLAQLSPAERQVLFQAIAGTDICDAPPAVEAIRALCRNRLEMRSGEFAPAPAPLLTAEQRLMTGTLESGTLPNLDRVIERLARGSSSRDDPSNQAIAAIALGTGLPQPAKPGDTDKPDDPRLGDDTQAVVNALINQFTGGAGRGQ